MKNKLTKKEQVIIKFNVDRYWLPGSLPVIRIVILSSDSEK